MSIGSVEEVIQALPGHSPHRVQPIQIMGVHISFQRLIISVRRPILFANVSQSCFELFGKLGFVERIGTVRHPLDDSVNEGVDILCVCTPLDDRTRSGASETLTLIGPSFDLLQRGQGGGKGLVVPGRFCRVAQEQHVKLSVGDKPTRDRDKLDGLPSSLFFWTISVKRSSTLVGGSLGGFVSPPHIFRVGLDFFFRLWHVAAIPDEVGNVIDRGIIHLGDAGQVLGAEEAKAIEFAGRDLGPRSEGLWGEMGVAGGFQDLGGLLGVFMGGFIGSLLVAGQSGGKGHFLWSKWVDGALTSPMARTTLPSFLICFNSSHHRVW